MDRNWIDVRDKLPDVPMGNEVRVIVAYTAKTTGERLTAEARYLNEVEMCDPGEYGNDGDPATGFFTLGPDMYGDEVYYTVAGCCGEVTHWLPWPNPPSA